MSKSIYLSIYLSIILLFISIGARADAPPPPDATYHYVLVNHTTAPLYCYLKFQTFGGGTSSQGVTVQPTSPSTDYTYQTIIHYANGFDHIATGFSQPRLYIVYCGPCPSCSQSQCGTPPTDYTFLWGSLLASGTNCTSIGGNHVDVALQIDFYTKTNFTVQKTCAWQTIQ